MGIAYEKTAPSLWATHIKAYVQQLGLPYPCLLGDDSTKELADVDAFPTLLFVDRTGEVRLVLRGYHEYERLDAVAKLLIDEA